MKLIGYQKVLKQDEKEMKEEKKNYFRLKKVMNNRDLISLKQFQK